MMIPRDVPRAVVSAVRAALELIDITGEVVGGMPALQESLGHDSSRATRAVVAACEELGYMRRVGPIGHGVRRLFVVEARLKSSEQCMSIGCHALLGKKSKNAQWCQACAQCKRADRVWWAKAVEMLVSGATMHEIAQATRQPLFPGDGTRGVVAFFLGEEQGIADLVPTQWAEALREASPEVARDVTGRRRLRRLRARRAA